MKTKIVSVDNIKKEKGQYHIDYDIQNESGQIEYRTKVCDNFREAGIIKKELMFGKLELIK